MVKRQEKYNWKDRNKHFAHLNLVKEYQEMTLGGWERTFTTGKHWTKEEEQSIISSASHVANSSV